MTFGNLGGYDENTVEVNSFEELGAGEYKAIIEDTELKESKAGNQYVSCKLVITEGPQEGRVHFENLNIGHPDSTVVEMAHKTIKSMSTAMGITGVKNHEDLRFDSHKKFIGVVRKVSKKGNLFTTYVAADKVSSAPAAPAAPVADESVPAWKR